ncbi:MAG: hypothetical protein LBD75_06510 [Candidatus Peribacteria bacterium]|jgi:hypothetical protein|nr:hypothetical protein [Candidatus Peribacteria bacterium]
MFLDSNNEESKYLNLWIAFESLFSDIEDESHATFNNIKNFTTDIICFNILKYYFDEFQDFLLSKQKIEKKEYPSTLRYTTIINKVIKNNQKYRKDHRKLNVVGILNFLQDE